MKYVVDHDIHIHSELSACSGHPEQTPAAILQYAIDNGYKTICLTDHFWDEKVPGSSEWYAPQDHAHVHKSLPLPQTEGVEFLFGVETEMTKDNVVAVSPERYDDFAFVIIPVSHFHMKGFALSMEDAATPEGRVNRFLDKMEALLDMPLPFHKIGLAHLANDTIGNRENKMYCQVLRMLMGERLEKLFTKAAALGVGIELNTSCFLFQNQEEEDAVIDFYKLAKKCGCKFYFGTDAHTPNDFKGRKAVAERAVELLGLTEDDKFVIGR